MLANIFDVFKAENVEYSDDGLEDIVFTSQGDMRQALNNLQSTKEGFGFVKSTNVFKVCDEPHSLLIKEMLDHCMKADIDWAYKVMDHQKKRIWASAQRTSSPTYFVFASLTAWLSL